MTLFEYLNQEFDILPLQTDLIEIKRICISELESEIKAVKAELERKRRKEECLVRSRDLWIRAFNKQKNDLKQAQAERDKLREEKNEFIRALKDCIDVLEQVRAERDELRAFVREVKNLSGRKTFPTEKELQETCNQAQELLNSKK